MPHLCPDCQLNTIDDTNEFICNDCYNLLQSEMTIGQNCDECGMFLWDCMCGLGDDDEG